MKKTLISAMFILLLIQTGCDKSKGILPVDEQQETINKLTGNWTLNTGGVVLDGVSIAGFEGFTLALGDRTYTTQNGNDVWPVSGTWDFKANSLTILTRDDGVEMSLSTISDNEITTLSGKKVVNSQIIHQMQL